MTIFGKNRRSIRKKNQSSAKVVKKIFGEDPFETAEYVAVKGSDALELNGKYVVTADNENNENEQKLEFSNTFGMKEVYLGGDAQNLTFNDAGGNVAIVDTGADGNKNITFGNGTGDLAIVDSNSNVGSVTITDGTGNDTVVVRGAMQTTFNMGEGKDVLIVTDNAGGKITLAGYNSDEDVISIQERIKSIADAIKNQTIQFGEGGKVKIVGTKAATEIDIDDSDSSNGWLVRLADPDGNKQLVGFTAEDGGLIGNASLEESIILVGNIDGKKLGGSSLQGGTRNDTIYAGEFDFVSAGAGRDFVSLKSDREFGAAINISEGITSIKGMNNSFKTDAGDVLYIDDLNMDSTSFAIENGNLVINESDKFKATIVDADTVKGGFVRQLIRTDDGTYRVAIGKDNGTIYVDDDNAPNVFIGNGAKVDFTNFSKKVFINLGGDRMESSIGSGAAYFKGVNNIAAGSGKDILIGSEGNDILSGGTGNDKLFGDAGKDTLNGGSGNDSLNGGTGNDKLFGDAGKDKLFGDAGKDKLFGGNGADTLSGGNGNDSLWGDSGKDTFIYSSGDGKDVIYGFDNDDMLKITGKFSATCNKSKSEVYFKVGTTSKAITLKDFTATSFNVNGSSYKISGTKVVK